MGPGLRHAPVHTRQASSAASTHADAEFRRHIGIAYGRASPRGALLTAQARECAE